MNVLMDKKRAAVVALLTVLLGTAALFVGAGSAQAFESCNDEPFPHDVQVDVSNGALVGVDHTVGSPRPFGLWVCLRWGTDTTTWHNAGVNVDDPSPSTPGATATVVDCTYDYCDEPVGATGAEVDPTTTTDAPLSGGTTTGGSAGIGSGTCVYADGTPTCPVTSTTLVSVTVNEADVAIGTHPNTGCVTAVGNPCVTTVPTGMGVSYLKGDPANDTVTAEVAGIPHSQDLGDCAGVNSGPGC